MLRPSGRHPARHRVDFTAWEGFLMCRPRLLSPFLAIVPLTIGLLAFGVRAETGDRSAPAQDVLAAVAAGEVDVKFIANDARSAQVVVKNRSGRPLTLCLPAGFAGVPVLAQMGMGGGMGGQGAGFGAGGIGGGPQNVGGGGMQGGMGGMGGMGGGMGGGFCWVAREVYGVHDPRWLVFRQWMIWQAPGWMQDLYRVHGEDFATWLQHRPVAKAALRLGMTGVATSGQSASESGLFRVATAADDAFTKPFAVSAGQTLAIRVPTVCLEYGRREPTPRMPYRLEPLTTVSEDPKLALVLGGLASGHLTQKVTQAAAWHIASGRTWEQLAAEVIDRAGGDPDLPMFTAAELAAARKAVELATRLSAAGPEAGSPTGTAAP
jgi:hypothetical protein